MRMYIREFWSFGNHQVFETFRPWKSHTRSEKYDLFHNFWIFFRSKISEYTHDTISHKTYDKYIAIIEFTRNSFTYYFCSSETFEDSILYFSLGDGDSHEELFSASLDELSWFRFGEFTVFRGSGDDEFYQITMSISECFRMKYIVECPILCLDSDTLLTEK